MNRYKILAHSIRWSVPFLNIFRRPQVWPYTLDELNKMHEGTLGHELYRFLSVRNLNYLPKYEVHDAYHALLGYGTTVTEELKLQAFMWGNRNATFAGRVLLIIGVCLFPTHWAQLLRELRRGRRALPLRPIPIASMMTQELLVLRKSLCLA